MVRKFKRPREKQKLEQLEAEGLWKAIALSKKIAESKEKITLEVILKIHKVIFQFAFPEVAGRFRVNGEDIKKLKYIEPPPGRLVRGRAYEFARELDLRIAKIPGHSNAISPKKKRERTDAIISLAAWIQYQITAIHPFCEGNGRMARLMTNLILKRYEFPASQVKIEGENKPAYLAALGQIDNYQDYEPLKHIIIQSVIASIQKEQKARKNKNLQ